MQEGKICALSSEWLVLEQSVWRSGWFLDRFETLLLKVFLCSEYTGTFQLCSETVGPDAGSLSTFLSGGQRWVMGQKGIVLSQKLRELGDPMRWKHTLAAWSRCTKGGKCFFGSSIRHYSRYQVHIFRKCTSDIDVYKIIIKKPVLKTGPKLSINQKTHQAIWLRYF
jgi:hypothetical protein